MRTRAVLLIVLLLGLGLRIYRVNWDEGYHFHPDERMIVMVVERLRWVNPVTERGEFFSKESPMNPKFFAYGSLPLYLLGFVGWLGGFVDPKWASYGYINLLGRGMSALFDGGVIVLVYLLGKEVANRRVGLLSALFYALAVLPIQLAHFYAVDTLLTFFITLSLYLLVKFLVKPGRKLAVASGLAVGAALATKVSGLMLAVPLLLVVAVDGIRAGWERWHDDRFWGWGRKMGRKLRFWRRGEKAFSWVEVIKNYWLPAGGWMGLIVVVAGVVFVVGEPYAVIDRETWWRQVSGQARMVRDARVFPYTLQYVGTQAYSYPLLQILRYGLGWSLGVVSLAGVVLAGIFVVGKAVHRRWLVHLVPDLRVGPTGVLLLFLIVYFGVVGKFAVKFVRYMLPIYPLLVLMAAIGVMVVGHGLVHVLGWKERRKRLLGGFLGLTVALFTFGWTVAFMAVYERSNTRIQASRWMAESLPAGTVLGVEHWDDALPVPPWSRGFSQVEFPLYEKDSYFKWAKMARNLEQVDVVVLASNRLYSPLMRLKGEYPLTERYYRKLFSGALGFEKVMEFTNYPRLGSWVVNDDEADETFHVYDHPKVMVFRKAKERSALEYLGLVWTE